MHNRKKYQLYNNYFSYSVFCGDIFKKLSNSTNNPFLVENEVVTVTSCGVDNITDLISHAAIASSHKGYNSFCYSLGNYFLKLQNKKFSTSSGHAIFVADVVDKGINIDALRLYLAYISPEKHASNFNIQKFVDFYNNWLVDKFFVFLARAVHFIKIRKLSNCCYQPLRVFNKTVCKVRAYLSLENFNMRSYVNSLLRYFDCAVRNLKDDGNAYWWLKGVIILFYPLMPAIFQDLWQQLNESGIPRIEDYKKYSSNINGNLKLKNIEKITVDLICK